MFAYSQFHEDVISQIPYLGQQGTFDFGSTCCFASNTSCCRHSMNRVDETEGGRTNDVGSEDSLDDVHG